MNTSETNNSTNQTVKKERSLLNSLIIGVLGLGSGLYLCFPGSIIVRAAVEMIPVIGQFDEAAAAAILFSCLSYFGLDLASFFGRAKDYDKRAAKSESAKPVDAKVVNS